MMELYEVEPDTDFFNHLICKKVEQSRSKDALVSITGWLISHFAIAGNNSLEV